MSLSSMLNTAIGAVRTQATNFTAAPTGKQLAIVAGAVQVAGMPFAYKRAKMRTAGKGAMRTATVAAKTLGGTVYLAGSYGKDLYDAYFGTKKHSKKNKYNAKAADKAIMALIGNQEPTEALVEQCVVELQKRHAPSRVITQFRKGAAVAQKIWADKRAEAASSPMKTKVSKKMEEKPADKLEVATTDSHTDSIFSGEPGSLNAKAKAEKNAAVVVEILSSPLEAAK